MKPLTRWRLSRATWKARCWWLSVAAVLWCVFLLSTCVTAIIRHPFPVVLTIHAGCVWIMWRTDSRPVSDPQLSAIEFSWSMPACFWLPGVQHIGPQVHVLLPLWIPPSLVSAVYAWGTWKERRFVRRQRLGLCVHCGYNRSGLLASERCPECGLGNER